MSTLLHFSSSTETFKSPADKSVLEVERGTHLEVSIGMREHNITSDENLYRLFLKYKSINLPPDVENNFDHLFSFHTGTCYSGGERSRCNELEVTLHGHPDLDGQNISLVVYRLVMPWGLPNMVRGLEAQQFMVRIVGEWPVLLYAVGLYCLTTVQTSTVHYSILIFNFLSTQLKILLTAIT